MDAPSFAALYAAHSARVRRALVLTDADQETAADVAQEAFARTYGRWRRVRTGTNPAGYVYRVAFRELRRRGHLPDRPDGDEAASQVVVDEKGPEERALAAGLTAEEAGQALGIAASTVRVQVHRARAELLALPALAPVDLVQAP